MSFGHKNRLYLKAAKVVAAFAMCSAALAAADIPAGWTCEGNCGTSGPDGVISTPHGGSNYQWVSTNGGLDGVGSLAEIGGSNGSTLTTNAFSAHSGEALNFSFNFATSDGAGYADYAWARLLDSNNSQVALLFTARTTPDGSIVPGFGMPTPEATLTPGSVPIIGGGPSWSPLGSSSGACYSSGCGYTGWVDSRYSIENAGTYKLQFGVTNWGDSSFDTGMALSGVMINDIPIGSTTPEPASVALLGLGSLAVAAGAKLSRRKQ